jgi:hypothetical protein
MALDELLVRHAARPTRLLLPLLFVSAVWRSAPIPPSLAVFRCLRCIHCRGRMAACRSARGDRGLEQMHFRVDVGDNLQARRIQTQVGVLRRTTSV